MKDNLRKKIVMGVCSAAILGQQAVVCADSMQPQSSQDQAHMTSDEQSFANKLSGSAKDSFMKMSHSDRSMAMKTASHDCKGQNTCKGQGGCKSDANSCKGQNSCKGKGTCKVSASDAVNMAMKRQNM